MTPAYLTGMHAAEVKRPSHCKEPNCERRNKAKIVVIVNL